MTDANSDPSSKTALRPSRAGAVVAGGGMLAGLGALIGASCCVLPIALASLGVSSAAVAQISFFAKAKPWFLGVAIFLLAANIILATRSGQRPSRRLLALLIAGVLLIAAAILLPAQESAILNLMNLK
jgi:mercuric ion transport protein